MFDKLPPGILPFEIIPELNEIARDYENKFTKREFVGESGAGIVKVTVMHPGKITKVWVDPAYFNAINQKLVEDLIPSAIERALDVMSNQWKDQMQEVQEKIQAIVRRFSENQESTSNQEKKAPGGSDENLN